MEKLQAIYKQKNVLLIGGRGFVGHHLSQLLLDLGANVYVFDDDSHPSIAPLNEQVAYIRGDAGNTEEIVQAYTLTLPDFIINLAAKVAGVLYNQHHHLEMFEENLACQFVPLRQSQFVPGKLPGYLHVSSVCVYGKGETSPCNDEYEPRFPPTGANAGYSWAKRLGEMYAQWLPREMRPVIVRPTNMYGPYDHFGPNAHVIPALVERIPKNQGRLRLFGDGKAIREFLYVTDAAEGMLYALAFGRRGQVYNLGTESKTATDIDKLARLIAKTYGPDERTFLYDHDWDTGDDVRWTACRKIHALGWQHRTSLEEGIQKTVEWYRANNRDGV